MEGLYPIPENWRWASLGQVAKWGSGGTPSRKKAEYYTGNISWIKTGELNDGFIYETEEHISEEAVAHSSAKIFPPHTVVIAMYGATIGKTGIMGVEAATNQACACATALPMIDYKYLFHYAGSQKEAFIRKGKGGAQPNISQEIIKSHEIPVPPLPEQRRIVQRVESLFAKLDEAAEKLQAVVDGSESRRTVILHKAFAGELTERWRKKRSQANYPWVNWWLADVLEDIPRNGYSPKPVSYPTSCKSLILSATTSGTFRGEYFKYIDAEIPEDSHLWLKPGDILLQRANSIDKVGVSAVYTGGEHEYIYPDLMMKLQTSDSFDPWCVAYYLKTKAARNYFRRNAVGTSGNMPKINRKIVCSLPVTLPAKKEEQEELVRILDNLLGEERRALAAAQAVLAQIPLVKKSILARAFRGELGTNNPAERPPV